MGNFKGNYYIDVDPDKCLGCKGCEIACVVAHAGGNLYSTLGAELSKKARNPVTLYEGKVAPNQCRQCEDVPCIPVCPVGAISQEEGYIKLEEDKCIGCKLCSKNCPFDAIVFYEVEVESKSGKRSKQNRAIKCDLCLGTEKKLLEENCACIKACPTKAITLKGGL